MSTTNLESTYGINLYGKERKKIAFIIGQPLMPLERVLEQEKSFRNSPESVPGVRCQQRESCSCPGNSKVKETPKESFQVAAQAAKVMGSFTPGDVGCHSQQQQA